MIDYRHLNRLEGRRDINGLHKTPEYHDLPICNSLMLIKDMPVFMYQAERVEMNEQEMEDIDEMVERFNADLRDGDDEMTAEEMVGYFE